MINDFRNELDSRNTLILCEVYINGQSASKYQILYILITMSNELTSAGRILIVFLKHYPADSLCLFLFLDKMTFHEVMQGSCLPPRYLTLRKINFKIYKGPHSLKLNLFDNEWIIQTDLVYELKKISGSVGSTQW